MLKIKNATADYTGGGFYLYTGQLEDGRYFVADNEYDSVCYLKESYGELIDDWSNERWEEIYIGTEENKNAFCDVLKWIKANKPKGNYLMTDIEATLSRICKD